MIQNTVADHVRKFINPLVRDNYIFLYIFPAGFFPDQPTIEISKLLVAFFDKPGELIFDFSGGPFYNFNIRGNQRNSSISIAELSRIRHATTFFPNPRLTTYDYGIGLPNIPATAAAILSNAPTTVVGEPFQSPVAPGL
jgi:hypothetical protein